MRPKKITAPERAWWCAEWLESARHGGLKTRLQRGKILAKEGRVQEVLLEAGLLQAEIRMSPLIKYRPTIQWPVLSDSKRDKVLEELGKKPHVLAQLLNGQLNLEWKEIFESVGMELFPKELAELTIDCSCGDPQHLCTHLAALYHIAADEFERNPAGWLVFRGIPTESWQKALPMMSENGMETVEEFTVQGFWEGEKLTALPVNQNSPLNLLQNLGPFPLWQGQGKGPAEGLKKFYLTVARVEEEELQGKDRSY